MLFSLSIFPIGEGDSLAHPVAEAIDEIDRAGLSYKVTAMDTQIEGEWDEVVAVVRAAQMRLLRRHPRVFLSLTVDAHKDAPQNRLDAAVTAVGEELGRSFSR